VEVELGLPKTPEGDPWTNYVALRFAWSDTELTMTRSLQETACLVKDEQRMESPSYIELASETQRTTILTGGLCFHRSTGPRLLDTLLVVEGEAERRFRVAVALDQAFPMQAALDWESPSIALPVVSEPPPSGATGWLFNVGVRNVLLRRILPVRGPAAAEIRSGCIVRLQETEGRNRTFPLGCYRLPARARQVDFDGQPLHVFPIENGAAVVSIAPFEVCDVELMFE
jgi:alpha-mannosidase